MDYQKAYLLLFNAFTDALEAINAQNFRQARQLLMTAQQSAQALFLEED